MNILQNLLSNVDTYLARGWEPARQSQTERVNTLRTHDKAALRAHGLTDGDDEEADVAQPIRRLIGQLLYEEAQHCTEIALIARHCHLHRGRSQSVTVTAVGGVRAYSYSCGGVRELQLQLSQSVTVTAVGGVRALQLKLWEESERYSYSCGRSQSVAVTAESERYSYSCGRSQSITVTAVGGVRALQLQLWAESERYSYSCGRSQNVAVTAVSGVRALQLQLWEESEC